MQIRRRGFKRNFEQAQCKESECIYIGDSDVDVFTAKNAGVSMLGVEWGFRGRKELTEAGAPQVAATADELLNMILAQK